MLSVSQDKPLKVPSVPLMCCCILCHVSVGSSLGVPPIGTLGRSTLLPPLPQQSQLLGEGRVGVCVCGRRLPAGPRGGGSSVQGWLSRRPREGMGPSSRLLPQHASSTPVYAQVSVAVTSGVGDIVAFVPPQPLLLRGRQRGGKFALISPCSCLEG